MIITCPACEAQYLLPDDSISANGRRVKCTSCSYTWLQSSNGAEEDVEVAKEFNYDVERAAKRQIYDPRQTVTPVTVQQGSWGRTLAAASGFAAFMIVVSLGFLILFKDYAMTKWPPLALFYETVGIPKMAPGSDLVLENVTASLAEDERVLLIKGSIKNPLKENRKLPNFLVRLSGKNGWLKDWPISLYEKTIVAEQSIGFEYGLKDTPVEGHEVTLRFAD